MLEASRSDDDLCPLSLTDAQLVFQHARLIILWDPLSQSKGLCICARSDSSSDTASHSASISELIKTAVWISHFEFDSHICRQVTSLLTCPWASRVTWEFKNVLLLCFIAQFLCSISFLLHPHLSPPRPEFIVLAYSREVH